MRGSWISISTDRLRDLPSHEFSLPGIRAILSSLYFVAVVGARKMHWLVVFLERMRCRGEFLEGNRRALFLHKSHCSA